MAMHINISVTIATIVNNTSCISDFNKLVVQSMSYMWADWEKGPLRTEAKFLFLIAHNCKAVIATDLKPGIAILQLLYYTRCKFHVPSHFRFGRGKRKYHAFENRPFYASRWCSTVSGRKI